MRESDLVLAFPSLEDEEGGITARHMLCVVDSVV